MTRLRCAVVGAGYLGRFHAQKYAALANCELVGIADPSADARERLRAELGVRGFAEYRELFGRVDAVSIATPTALHHPVARDFLEAGIHVLVEKPITATADEARELIAIAAARGCVLQVGHLERFNPVILATAHELSNPRFIESNRLAPFKPRGTDVSVVLDLMIHDIDLVRTFVGGGVSSVSAVGVPVLTPFPDIANARITFETGAVANITASRVSRERMRKLRIFQQSGYLSLDLAAGTGEFYRLRGDVDLAALVRDAQGAQALESFVERIPLEAPEGEPLRLELENFLAAIRGRAEIAVTGDDGREALGVALTIVREIERSMPALARGMPAFSRA
jgi:predicted dehydrogenase